MANLCNELQRILQQQLLSPLFQPIVSLPHRQIIGFEALIRGPSDSPLHSPLKLFESAYQCDLLETLEMSCREASIREFSRQQGQGLLFLNVNPLLLLHSDHPSGLTLQLLKRYGIDPSSVVIELSEQYQVDDSDLLSKAVQHYRQLGFQIAIDDLGSGFSGLKLWSEIKPDIIKIDRYFISQLEQDPTKKAFVRTIIDLAKTTGARVVAEGIETQAELDVCQELGADYAQGFLLARPHAQLATVLQSSPQMLDAQPHACIGDFMVEPMLVTPDAKVRQVWQLFEQHSELSCVAVVEQCVAVGVVTRAALHSLYAGPYGRALYDNKPIRMVMQQQIVRLQPNCSIDEVPQRWRTSQSSDLAFAVVEDAQGYRGIVSLQQLLEQQTAAKLQHARYANPLTLLPGNVPLHREIDRLLQQQADFRIAYLDLDHFKAFNDFYGYSRGDSVILWLATLVQTESRRRFVAHIGGDDFVVVFQDDEWELCLRRVQQLFSQRIGSFYDEEQRRAGGIHACSRRGEMRFFPLMTLSIGIAHPDPLQCRCHHDVAALAASAKQQAKQLAGRDLFISRRRVPQKLAS